VPNSIQAKEKKTHEWLGEEGLEVVPALVVPFPSGLAISSETTDCASEPKCSFLEQERFAHSYFLAHIFQGGAGKGVQQRNLLRNPQIKSTIVLRFRGRDSYGVLFRFALNLILLSHIQPRSKKVGEIIQT